MRTGEIRYLFEYMSQEPFAAMTLWTWYKANYKALLMRLSADGMARAPGALRQACDIRSSDELKAFFNPKVATLRGIARPLSLAEEDIARCVAFRQSEARDIAAALRSAQ